MCSSVKMIITVWMEGVVGFKEKVVLLLMPDHSGSQEELGQLELAVLLDLSAHHHPLREVPRKVTKSVFKRNPL